MRARGAGVEQHGVGHWMKVQADPELGHRSNLDIRNKWNSIAKTVKGNKRTHSVELMVDDVARVRVRTRHLASPHHAAHCC